MSNDFEVVPIGSIEELIRTRECFAKLIEFNAKNDIASIRKEIDSIKVFYNDIIDRTVGV